MIAVEAKERKGLVARLRHKPAEGVTIKVTLTQQDAFKNYADVRELREFTELMGWASEDTEQPFSDNTNLLEHALTRDIVFRRPSIRKRNPTVLKISPGLIVSAVTPAHLTEGLQAHWKEKNPKQTFTPESIQGLPEAIEVFSKQYTVNDRGYSIRT